MGALASRVEYFETVDFTWTVARQLDRVMDAYTSIEYDSPGIGVRRLYMALRALYALTSFMVSDALGRKLFEASRLMREGKAREALAVMDEVLRGILEGLDRKGVLLRKQEYAIGAFGGED